MRRIAIMTMGVACALAACGDSATDDSVATLQEDVVTTTSLTPAEAALAGEEAVLAYVQCLRDEGLEIADPDFDSEGGLGLRRQFVTDPEAGLPDDVQRAFDACEPLRTAGEQRFENVDLSDYEDRLLAFAACMRTEGLADFPDPDLSVWKPGAGLGPGNGPFGTAIFDLEGDTSGQVALATCQASFGGPGTGQGGEG